MSRPHEVEPISLKRRLLLVGGSIAGFSMFAAVLSRLDFGGAESNPEEEFESTREEACSHVPDDVEKLSYSVSRNTVYHVLPEEREPFALITTQDQLEELFPSEERDRLREDMGNYSEVFEEIHFDEQILLVWETETTNTSGSVSFLDVTRPDSETVHAYSCKFQTGALGGDEHKFIIYFITVDTPETPTEAKLTHRSKFARSDAKTTTYTEEAEDN